MRVVDAEIQIPCAEIAMATRREGPTATPSPARDQSVR